MVQQSFRSGPTPIATTWLAPLPTPPPSAPVPRGQTSPTGFPIHAPVPTGSFLLPHHPQIVHEPPALSALPAVAQSRYLQQGTSEQPNAAMHIPLPRGEIMDTTNNELVSCSKQDVAPASSISSPRSAKRPNSQFQTSVSPGGEHKKARIEGVAEHPMTADTDTHPIRKIPSPPAPTDPQNDPKLTLMLKMAYFAVYAWIDTKRK
ncbi:hypothetical protein EV363DRAFT_524653 [Boletus edulis]|nr:hypothetical protein EV363DRAFT_524653 [Boletus edulis]